MTVARKFLSGAAVSDETLGDRQIKVIASTATPDRVKDVMRPEGCDLTNYKNNPIVLANHNPEFPIGTASVDIKNGRVEALIDFAPPGASQKADEYCALAKAGIINTVSVGFEPISYEPIKGGGLRINEWELLELSLVSVPCNPEATVIARSLEKSTMANWKCGASRNLPLDDDASWDGPEAEKSIFDKAGFDGDEPEGSFARKGFLCYDAEKEDEKGGYKLPFARVVDGRLKACRAGIRAAASRLEQTDIPDDVKEKARAVIDHYEGQFKAEDEKAKRSFMQKGLYAVSRLAYLLSEIGYLRDMSEWEEEVEGDESPVPGMLTESLRQLGDVLLSMTEEEVKELLADDEAGEDTGEETEDAGEKAKNVFARKLLKHIKTTGIVIKAPASVPAPANDDIQKAAHAARLRELEMLRLKAL